MLIVMRKKQPSLERKCEREAMPMKKVFQNNETPCQQSKRHMKCAPVRPKNRFGPTINV